MVLITAYQDMASPEILILNSLIKQRIGYIFTQASSDSLIIYPFNFELQIQYTLDENNLEIKYTVVTGNSTLPFSIERILQLRYLEILRIMH
jgi:hypothetical protein